MALDPGLKAKLEGVTTATLTTVLVKKGLRNVWIRGSKPFNTGGKRVVGPAFTMRFVPAREDLATPAAWTQPNSTRGAIEDMPEGVFVVIDAAGGVQDAGVFGDILSGRMVKRGVVGMVTDGVVRDAVGVRGTGLPIWCNGVAAPPSVAGLHFVGWQEAIGCGGVCIIPGDVIVADDDGAVVIPADLVEQIVDDCVEQERLEAWIVTEVERGVPLPGLYPANAETKARYEAWKAVQK